MKKGLLKQHNLIDIFFSSALVGAFITAFGALAYYIVAFASLSNGSQSFDWLLCIFSDFVEIMNISIEESPYILEGSSYPPLAIAILYPFALICKGVFAKYAGQTLTVNELSAKLTMTAEFWIAFILFFSICSLLIIAIISKKYNLRGVTLFKVSIIIMVAAPFGYTLMRGNSIFTALIFTLLFILLKDSKNAVLRDVSYICLAIAGCLKIYPLFFGVFLLKDKKIFASIRVALYFFAIFFASFFLFERDLHDLSEFTENLGGFMSNEERLLGTTNLSLTSMLFKLFSIFVPNISADNPVFSTTNLIIIVGIFILCCVAAIATKNDFSRLMICSSIVVLVPSISYFYVLTFTVLPFLNFILNNKNDEPKSRFNLYLFAFLFLYSPIFVFAGIYLLHSIVILILLGVEVVSVFKNEIFKSFNTSNI